MKGGVLIRLRFMANLILREECFTAPVSLVNVVPKGRSVRSIFLRFFQLHPLDTKEQIEECFKWQNL